MTGNRFKESHACYSQKHFAGHHCILIKSHEQDVFEQNPWTTFIGKIATTSLEDTGLFGLSPKLVCGCFQTWMYTFPFSLSVIHHYLGASLSLTTVGALFQLSVQWKLQAPCLSVQELVKWVTKITHIKALKWAGRQHFQQSEKSLFSHPVTPRKQN